VAQFAYLPEGRRMMAAMVKAMDDGVAAILDALECLGLRENTIVFMSSDNGPSIEERNWLNGEEISYDGGSAGGLRGHKGSLFEGGIRVPTIISWPAALPAGRPSDVVGCMADVVPTVLEAVDGVEPADESIDGRSVLPLLRSGEAGRDRWLFWQYEGQLAGRLGRWKVVLDACESMQTEVAVPEGLYDLVDDPGEQRELSRTDPDRFRRMREELQRWAKCCDSWRSEAPAR
jgi:arylsulfatase A-like enzyme